MNHNKTRPALSCYRSAFSIAAVLLLLAVPARAEFLNSFEIGLHTGAGDGSFTVDVPQFADNFTWVLSSPVDIYSTTDSGMFLGTLKEFSVELNGDPGISLGFNVTANAGPTLVTVTSATVSFTPLQNAQGFASAAITVTDNDSNGATATGLFPGTNAYQATIDGSNVYANLITPILAGIDSSNTGSDRVPLSGTSLVPLVGSIKTEFSFILSANDSASGTSRFNISGGTITPEPSTLFLALCGAIGLLWQIARRRRAAIAGN